MQTPLQITFRNMDASPALEAEIRRHTDKLEQICYNITRCQVVIEPVQRNHIQGNVFQVKIDLTVPGAELVVSREPGKNHAHEDAYVAARDAFTAMRRKVEAYVDKRKGQTKTHDPEPHGRVRVLEPLMDYGIIETHDGRDVYFHRNSVLDGEFDELEPGARVHFSEEMGEEGPQASTVHVEGKRHVVGRID